jgi:uncharacterized protein (TIGR02001 family)
MMRAGCFGALMCVAALPAFAASDITLSGNAALLTQYVDRGITNSAERPAAQVEFDLCYKKIYYAGVWGSNVDFGPAPSGQDLADIELDYYVGLAPTAGKWSFDIAAYYVAYPGAFDGEGEFNYVEIWTGVSRKFFADRLELTLYNYWSPDYSRETGHNDVLELTSEWTFAKVWSFTPKLSGTFGRQWGDLSQGGYDYTYWNAALTLGFKATLPLELEIRYWDSFDFDGFSCPPSGVNACTNLVVGSLKATF